MLGENPVRQSVTPISSATDTNRFLKISNSIGFVCIVTVPRRVRIGGGEPAARPADRDHVPELIDPEAEMRRNDNGCLLPGDDRGSVGNASRQQVLPSVNRRRHLPSAERGRRCAPGSGRQLALISRRGSDGFLVTPVAVNAGSPLLLPDADSVAVQPGVLPVDSSRYPAVNGTVIWYAWPT